MCVRALVFDCIFISRMTCKKKTNVSVRINHNVGGAAVIELPSPTCGPSDGLDGIQISSPEGGLGSGGEMAVLSL